MVISITGDNTSTSLDGMNSPLQPASLSGLLGNSEAEAAMRGFSDILWGNNKKSSPGESAGGFFEMNMRTATQAHTEEPANNSGLEAILKMLDSWAESIAATFSGTDNNVVKNFKNAIDESKQKIIHRHEEYALARKGDPEAIKAVAQYRADGNDFMNAIVKSLEESNNPSADKLKNALKNLYDTKREYDENLKNGALTTEEKSEFRERLKTQGDEIMGVIKGLDNETIKDLVTNLQDHPHMQSLGFDKIIANTPQDTPTKSRSHEGQGLDTTEAIPPYRNITTPDGRQLDNGGWSK